MFWNLAPSLSYAYDRDQLLLLNHSGNIVHCAVCNTLLNPRLWHPSVACQALPEHSMPTHLDLCWLICWTVLAFWEALCSDMECPIAEEEICFISKTIIVSHMDVLVVTENMLHHLTWWCIGQCPPNMVPWWFESSYSTNHRCIVITVSWMRYSHLS